MSLAANRPLNWNVLSSSPAWRRPDGAPARGGRLRRRAGGREVLALTIPDGTVAPLCFASGFLLDTIPGWEKPMTLPHDEKMALFASAEGGRTQLDVGVPGKAEPSSGWRTGAST